jgi:dihydrofolate reductase
MLMRTITYGAATSLDGFIARKDQAVDWLAWSDDVSAIMSQYWSTVDTVLMGRKTYEIAAASEHGAGGGLQGIKTYVFSRTLKPREHRSVSVVADDAVPFVAGLKREQGKGICLMGGGEFAGVLIEHGLVDEIGLNVHPVLLGSGIPMFRDAGHQTDLDLIECRPIKGGCVYVRYRVKHSGAKR